MKTTNWYQNPPFAIKLASKIYFIVILFVIALFNSADFASAYSKTAIDGAWTVNIDKMEATANGSDVIRLNIVRNDQSLSYSSIDVIYRGTGIGLSLPSQSFQAEVTSNYASSNCNPGGNDGVSSCEFLLTSTSSGSKTIKVTEAANTSKNVELETIINENITFADSIPSSPTTAPTVTPTPKPSTKKTTTTSAPTPNKPTLTLDSTANTQLNNPPIPITPNETPTIKKSDKLTFSGTTSPNAKVTLVIKSDPISKEVTADKDGKWTFVLDPRELGLDYGEHTVTAYATDSSGVKSDELALAKFTIEKLPPVEPTTLSPHKFTWRDLLTPINYVLGGIAVILVGCFAYLIIKRRKLAGMKTTIQNSINS